MNGNIDKLTGCLTDGSFLADFEELAKAADEKKQELALVSIDIDMFSRVNQEFGHDAGDAVLREIARVLLEIPAWHKSYRSSHHVLAPASGGGDHFTLLFPDCEKERAFLLMEEARKKIEQSPECARTKATVSAGVAAYPEDGARITDLMRRADGALYRAKAGGRNKIALAKEDKLVTKTAHYTVEQLKRLEKLAQDQQISEAALMREALDELLKKYDS